MTTRNPSRSAFSLIELLVVISVMTALSAVGIPAMMGLSKSRNLSNGGNLLVGLSTQARQNALSTNRPTALVMVNNSGTHPDWSHRLFVLVEFNAEAGTWSPVSKWFLLPEGIVVDSAGSTFGDSAVAMDRSPGDLQYAGRTFAPSDYSYQIFLPGGHMATSSVEPISPNLRVIEKPILPSGGPSGNYYNITLNLMTSIPIVSRP